MNEEYEPIIRLLDERKESVSTMESCTGGSLADHITNIEGASDVFQFGAVTYSNEFKIKMGVDASIIDMYGVYSMETAKEMARAISSFTNSTYGIGITGKLGVEDPSNPGGSDHMVYISIYDQSTGTYLKQTLTVAEQDRVSCKKTIIHLIFMKLLKYLNEK